MAKVRKKCLGRQTRLSVPPVPRLVSLVAFFGCHATLPRKDSVFWGGALRDIQKRAARVTIPGRELFQH